MATSPLWLTLKLSVVVRVKLFWGGPGLAHLGGGGGGLLMWLVPGVWTRSGCVLMESSLKPAAMLRWKLEQHLAGSTAGLRTFASTLWTSGDGDLTAFCTKFGERSRCESLSFGESLGSRRDSRGSFRLVRLRVLGGVGRGCRGAGGPNVGSELVGEPFTAKVQGY